MRFLRRPSKEHPLTGMEIAEKHSAVNDQPCKLRRCKPGSTKDPESTVQKDAAVMHTRYVCHLNIRVAPLVCIQFETSSGVFVYSATTQDTDSIAAWSGMISPSIYWEIASVSSVPSVLANKTNLASLALFNAHPREHDHLC
jgi:hypothetical protein